MFRQNVVTKNIVSIVPKKDLIIAYLGKLTLQKHIRINRIMKNKLRYCNIQFVFQTKCKISNLLAFKGRIRSFLRSGIVFKFQCGGCRATYYGKTKCHFKIKMCKQLGILALLFSNHSPDFENFSIFTTNSNNFKVTLMKSLIIW